jgi:hypothetical protein
MYGLGSNENHGEEPVRSGHVGGSPLLWSETIRRFLRSAHQHALSPLDIAMAQAVRMNPVLQCLVMQS